MRFGGRTALITGGASGIGAATARKFAREGAQVILVDIDEEAGERVASEIGQMGATVSLHVADLTDQASTAACAAAVAQDTPALHALINNAGVFRSSSIEQTGRSDWDAQVPVNLLAPVQLTQGLLPLLRAEGGAIVNLSSEGAFWAHPNRWVYDATKAALGAATRTMAAEFVDYGIRANAVAPGWIVTEMHFGAAPDPAARKRELETKRDSRICLMGRLGHPEEVADAIFFLASDEASYITGTTLHVDGGRVMR